MYGRQSENEDGSDKTIMAIRPGEQARTEAIEVKECRTKPPARFNEGTLLSAMEGAGKLVDDEELREAMSERGLGTPATRAQIIEGLIYEGYLLRQGKELIVTQKGISLITLLRDLHAEALTKPELTGEWEFKLKQMERGKLSREAFMGEIRQLTTDLVGKVRTGMGKEIRGEFHPLAVKCPRCDGGPYNESFKAYECASGCKTIVWKTMAGREFQREEVVKLLTEGRVGPLEGFRSKLGRSFAAVVVLDAKSEWKQRFDFEKDEAAEGESPAWINPEPLGKCPVCQEGQVFEAEGSYQCDRTASKKCNFRMGRKSSRRTSRATRRSSSSRLAKRGSCRGSSPKRASRFRLSWCLARKAKWGSSSRSERKNPEVRSRLSAARKLRRPTESQPVIRLPSRVGRTGKIACDLSHPQEQS